MNNRGHSGRGGRKLSLRRLQEIEVAGNGYFYCLNLYRTLHRSHPTGLEGFRQIGSFIVVFEQLIVYVNST